MILVLVVQKVFVDFRSSIRSRRSRLVPFQRDLRDFVDMRDLVVDLASKSFCDFSFVDFFVVLCSSI